eukprot:m.142560 g.142560  ORF g.142560 m.142560 type:complete len:271 (+) comp14074_c0_seq2:1887-2699(+)
MIFQKNYLGESYLNLTAAVESRRWGSWAHPIATRIDGVQKTCQGVQDCEENSAARGQLHVMDFLFGKKKPTPEEQVKEWTNKIRSEQRQLDRQIREIERSERGIQAEVKKHAKNGDVGNARILAKSLANSRKAKNRIRVSIAQMESIKMEMRTQARMARMSQTFEVSTRVMKAMNNMVNMRTITETMRGLEKEMMTAGVIEETVGDAMDSLDDPELEDAADEEVEKVLYDITAGEMGKLPEKGGGTLVSELPDTVSEEQAEAFIRQMMAT